MDVGPLGINPHRPVVRINDNAHKLHSRHLIHCKCYFFSLLSQPCLESNQFNLSSKAFSNRVLGASKALYESQISSWAAVLLLITNVSILRKPQDAVTGICMKKSPVSEK